MKTSIKFALALTAALAVAQPASAQIIRNPNGGAVVVRDGNGNVIRQDGAVVRNDGTTILRDGTVIDTRTGQVIRSGSRTTTGRAPGDNRMRVYTDAQGCKVKEQTKRNGDYRYERKCKGQPAQRRDANGVWRTIQNGQDGRWDRRDREDDDDRFDNDRDEGRGHGNGKGHGKKGKGHGDD